MVSSKKVNFLLKVLPQAAKLPGTSGFFQKNDFLEKSSAPGSEAAWDKWLLQTKRFSGKRAISGKSSAPGSEIARDKWFLKK